MLDVAIVGGGVCGLALARGLARRGLSFALFEARDRLGGRVLSVENRTSGQRLDLGPTWFWPQTQPAIAALVAELGLEAFDQHDPGAALYLGARNAAPVIRAAPDLHGGAQRLSGGMASLVEALAAALPPDALHLAHRLSAVRDAGDHVDLLFDKDGAAIRVAARRVALAIPPRLLAECVQFEPPLPEDLSAAMAETPTWMAASAKAVTGFETPPVWRAFGQSGDAFVTHELAILGEVFDACDARGEKAALGGFFALAPDLREKFRESLAMLAASQFAELFGKSAAQGESHIQDWAREPFTCAAADRDAAPDAHPDYGAPPLCEPVWDDKLHFGASETAREGGGYVEGALNAASRIEGEIAGKGASMTAMHKTAMHETESVNDVALDRFREWAASRRETVFADYRKRLNLALSRGERDQLTQRAMLGAMEAVFAEALAVIDALPFDPSRVAVERGRSELTPQVQAAFDGFIQSFLDAVIEFNRTSCALSNFPSEHRLSKDYVSTTLRDVAAAWREFSLAANSRFVAQRGAAA
ncbi:flavin monoamine oxidase family protein [Methylocystis parvus]|uniref:NAD(P)-binding protein n=1 Tax=Methylocystis parvus TaxID=134 RepID=A0A6B8M360_9HYPH|nr:FAD-dependent oxidoreductase [Methylocystis parvus]QGM97361.1 NAD(P)-binding protein [Methylocystis parvus]WBJ98727.1 FAD-dependent oxidoreductase [Methylocystis parvus OBBP]